MPEKATVARARKAKRAGKAPSSQAGEFVREEMHHIREGKHGARSTKQAIAIGLSKARRAGVKLRPPGRGKASAKTRASARSAYAKGQSLKATNPRRARATRTALKREGKAAASKASLARQGHKAAQSRSAADRRAAARKAARTRRRRASS
jgi:hypothetical protein